MEINNEMIRRVYSFVNFYDEAVSFAEIAREFGEGKYEFRISKNLVAWSEMPADVIDAIMYLVLEDKIVLVSTSLSRYELDGMRLRLPIAEEIKDYDTPKWYPVLLDTKERFLLGEEKQLEHIRGKK